ncbi:MAG: ABC transporter permease [Caldiserica bacterium]|nr:ABC transporter permease [Caldisericota bacterium]
MRRIRAVLRREWAEAMRIKMVLFSVCFFPLFMTGFAAYLVWQGRALPPQGQAVLLNTALIYFLVLPVVIPLSIAAYSIVGEKEQGTLEPLLATPIRDWELFLGKSMAPVIPGLILSWAAFGLFLLASRLILGEIPRGVLSLPWFLSIFALAPFLALFAVFVTMIVSSRTSDTRAAYQFSSLAVLPALIPLIVYSARLTAVNLAFVGIEAGILLPLNALALYIAVRLFRREEILTRWR